MDYKHGCDVVNCLDWSLDRAVQFWLLKTECFSVFQGGARAAYKGEAVARGGTTRERGATEATARAPATVSAVAGSTCKFIN